MGNNSISVKDAMSKWHLTLAQAEQLDKMDDDADNGVKGNGKISGNIYDMAKSYYEKTHKDENAKEANRPQLFKNLVTWINETKEMIESMKNGFFDGEDAEETSAEDEAASD